MATEPRYGAMSRDFQSFAGPGDRDLPMSEVQGYQPVSRIGEIVMNAFVDSYEFASLKDALTGSEMTGDRTGEKDGNSGITTEYKPMFHEWAVRPPARVPRPMLTISPQTHPPLAAFPLQTVQPGMICLAR